MGTTATLHCAREFYDQAVSRLDQLEELWSRFLPDSDITRIIRSDGDPVLVSPETIELVQHLITAGDITRGAFDPTLVDTLCSLGYASSRSEPGRQTVPVGPTPAGISIGDVDIDRAASTIRVPPGLGLDPGGLGKGLAADIVTRDVMAAGATGVMVEVGGDLRVMGRPETGDSWVIEVHDPEGREVIDVIALLDGGIATSTTRLRTWEHAGESQHHLIDPRTGRPSKTGIVGCTVVAGTAAWAEAMTKVPFSASLDETMALFEHHRLAALVIRDDGERIVTREWKEFSR